MVSRSEFWGRLLQHLSGIVEGLGEGECSKPLSLAEAAADIGVDYGRVKAPQLISIDVLEDLPRVLRSHGLYVVRLGQYHTGRASFILCRARPGYRREVLRPEDVSAAPRLPVEPRQPPRWVVELAGHLGAEALASVAAVELVEALARGGKVYMLSSLRFGNAVFRFQPSSCSETYTYRGQVEVDAVLGEGSVYTLEAKTLSRRRSVFKYKIAFSAQALAETLGQEVHPLVAFVEKRGGSLAAVAALLAPAAVPGTPYPVEEMRPRVRLAVEIL
ncbi:hypothetical protein [Pyrodictium abyssi]